MVANSIKFSKLNGFVQIKVRYVSFDTDNLEKLEMDKVFDDSDQHVEVDDTKKRGYLITQIIDTGSGIPKSHPNIFNAFSNMSRENKALSTEGVGVGLTTAKNQVHSLGGEIYLRSTVGEGKYHTFSLQKPQFIVYISLKKNRSV